MVVPPARPIDTTSSDDSTSESSVRRVRPGTLAPPARFYTPCSAPKPHLDGLRATLQSQEVKTMSVLARRFGVGLRVDRRFVGSAGFAVKMVGVGLLAGLLLVVCQFLIDAWFRAIR